MNDSHKDMLKDSVFATLTAACRADPARTRFRFLDESAAEQTLTGGDILTRSLAFAKGLQTISETGDRVLLPFPPGLDFIIGFLGCIAANRLPVPANYPKARRPLSRYEGIAKDCHADIAISTASTLQTINVTDRAQLEWFSVEDMESRGAPGPIEVVSGNDSIQRHIQEETDWVEAQAKQGATANRASHFCDEDVLFLQYTSGSTSKPKGVMITPENLISNLTTICHGFGLNQIPPEARIVCSWLPAYHDMGLVGVILSTLIHDGEAVLMSPASFLRRPALWLESIQQHRASITVSPSFGYQWATSRISQQAADQFDLGCLRLAACGAEPISPVVLKQFSERFQNAGFRSEAFYPCYGLAESTLMVSGDHRGASPNARTKHQIENTDFGYSKHFDRAALSQNQAIEIEESNASIEVVHCGMPGLNTNIEFACPKTGARVQDGSIGEIVVNSPSNAAGYWNAAERTCETFAFSFPDEDQTYLRTGDLGFLQDGRLYVTGRCKEIIIIAGQNFYPHDIENTVKAAHQALAHMPSAAFAKTGESTEQLVLVQEIPRGLPQDEQELIIRKIRLAVVSTHELAPAAVILVRVASIPRTSSGKVQRLETRDSFLKKQLNVLSSWEYKATEDTHLFKDVQPLLRTGNLTRLQRRIENTLLNWVAFHTGDTPEFIKADQSFAEMGVDSLQSVQLAQDFERWLGCHISPVAVWSYPTPTKMTEFLLSQLQLETPTGANTLQQDVDEKNPLASSIPEGFDLASLLDQLEGMNEEEVHSLLGNEPFDNQ